VECGQTVTAVNLADVVMILEKHLASLPASEHLEKHVIVQVLASACGVTQCALQGRVVINAVIHVHLVSFVHNVRATAVRDSNVTGVNAAPAHNVQTVRVLG
jgi:hypothetical protein